MHGLQPLIAFAETAKQGGFAAASRELGTAPSTLAKAVARLEATLGVKLFHRTTRQVGLTPDGERLYARCQRVLAELEELQADAAGTRAAPAGTLKIDAPIVYGRRWVMPRLAALARTHPGLQLEVRLSDGYADLVRDGVDLAVRAGALADSSLVARRIDAQEMVLVGSPAYLREHGTPRRIAELARHVAVVFRLPSTGRSRAWQLRQRGAAVEIEPRSRVRVNDGEGMVAGLCAGLGLGQLPDYMVDAERRSGRLVEVLAACRPEPMPISLVWPSGRLLPARVRVAIEALASIGEARAASAGGSGAAPSAGRRAGRH
jgi:DNA-binding transcriptional LysR family regulator